LVSSLRCLVKVEDFWVNFRSEIIRLRSLLN
jgi:hypothetical protein